MSFSLGNSQVSTNLPRQKIVNFCVSGNAGGRTCLWIEEDRVSAAFAQQLTAMRSQVTQEVTPLHTCAIKCSLLSVHEARLQSVAWPPTLDWPRSPWSRLLSGCVWLPQEFVLAC